MEFAALLVGVEMNDGLGYKLHMMGIPVKGPTNIYCYCDYESIISNPTMAGSTLKKKHLTVCYYIVQKREANSDIYY